ncbi:farnesyl cysteine-carboxyl methyltransferase [Elasticomyces elasticus]|nr:farnesyl cysteine-carboxyl methyltransferase [Elasticomyces elasticus]
MARTRNSSNTARPSQNSNVPCPEPDPSPPSSSSTSASTSSSTSTSPPCLPYAVLGTGNESRHLGHFEHTPNAQGLAPEIIVRASAYPTDSTLCANGLRSLSSIAAHAFVIGLVLSASLISTLYFAYLRAEPHPIWRAPEFIATLCIFHFLEFYTTARWNTASAKVSSFLLFGNGAAYNVAHGTAMCEILITAFLFPKWQSAFANAGTLAAGITMVVVGQAVRSVAMAQAGTNFNHIPAQEKKEGHELVTHGVYGWLRHPSYFGFFWWAVGTQVVVGNKLCALGYAYVLWEFFDKRIKSEEKSLVEFFGSAYEEYRAQTPTGIPFIR